MVQDKTYVVISTLVDATIKEYQPDVDFKLFRTIDELRDYVDRDPLRAQLLFFTEDVVGQSNTAFSVLSGLINDNDYLAIDRIIYIANTDSNTIKSLQYLIEDKELKDWEIIPGNVTRAFVQEVINGTYRDDQFNAQKKVVVRRPRADYVKQQLKNHETLDQEYPDDDNDLSGIPDEEPIFEVPQEVPASLRNIYVTGPASRERTALAFLAAQYLSKSSRTIILESDPDYHLLTEFATKSGVEADVVTVSMLYDNVSNAMEAIKATKANLVIIECIDRIAFNYRYLCSLLFYNLETEFDYFVVENAIEDVPEETNMIVVMPSTVTGLLSVGETIDKSWLPYCDFVGVDLLDLPETHISSGVVMSKILNDIMSDNGIVCPVITISSLRLDGACYDFGTILGRSLMQ